MFRLVGLTVIGIALVTAFGWLGAVFGIVWWAIYRHRTR